MLLIFGLWTPRFYVKSLTAAAGMAFGTSVLISDDALVVGAPGQTALTPSGIAYVY